LGDTIELFNMPMHPYTQLLVSTISQASVKFFEYKLKGEPPSPLNPPSGCRFHTRCPYATAICSEEEPKMVEVSKGHFVACHNLEFVKSGLIQAKDRAILIE